MKYKVALPDLVSNSYFPAIAAVELGFFKNEGIDAEIELIFPVPETFNALREGKCDFVAGSTHAPLSAFPRWEGARVLCALSQGMYWFLVEILTQAVIIITKKVTLRRQKVMVS